MSWSVHRLARLAGGAGWLPLAAAFMRVVYPRRPWLIPAAVAALIPGVVVVRAVK